MCFAPGATGDRERGRRYAQERLGQRGAAALAV
jgi:hypothetical protein